MAKRIILIRNRDEKKIKYTMMDGDAFSRKHNSPCKPDIYFYRQENCTGNGGMRRTVSGFYVVEIETHATKESLARKRLQYEQTLKGVELIIINLDELEDQDSLIGLDNFLEARIP